MTLRQLGEENNASPAPTPTEGRDDVVTGGIGVGTVNTSTEHNASTTQDSAGNEAKLTRNISIITKTNKIKTLTISTEKTKIISQKLYWYDGYVPEQIIGISYKTIERFFDKKIDWLSLKRVYLESLDGT